MYHTSNFSDTGVVPLRSVSPEKGNENSNMGVRTAPPTGGNGKNRLRWTSDLHDRFVDAIAQLGGPDSGSNTERCLESDGCSRTYYISREKPFTGSEDKSKGSKDGHLDSSEGMEIGDALRMQMEVQKRLQEQLEVQRQLQLRIEAQGKYLQKIIEEQHKLSNDLKASDKLELNDENNHSEMPSNSGPPLDASTSSTSPRKKQKLDE